MRKIFTLLLSLGVTSSAFAQTPQKMSYQAVIRNSSNQLVVTHPVGMKISILQGSTTGTAIYTETQTPNTNANGLVSIEIGGSAGFDAINWASGLFFIKTETDPTGGTNYTITGTSQLLSVPYAFYAKTAGNGFIHYLGESKDGGIIFYIYKGNDGQEHGLIVALNEQTNTIMQNTGVLVNANRSWDGAYNTNLLTDSPAKTYVTNLGAGWYIPSIDELSILWHNRFHVNKALSSGGNTLLSNSENYWSSSEFNDSQVWYFNFSCGLAIPYSKSYPYSIRAIRSF